MWRALAGGALIVATSSLVGPARGDAPVDVTVKNVGASDLKVRVAEGGASVGAAHEIFTGNVGAESTLTLKTSQRCVWVEQTLVDASGPWSPAEKFCRPQICKGEGRAYACETIEGAPIKLDIDAAP
jgi:hypothetical protein